MTRTSLPRRPSTAATPPAGDTPDPYPSLPAPLPPPPATLPAPEDLTPDELAAFEQMNDALRAKVLELRVLAGSEVVGLLQSRYAIGSMILEIKEHPEVYGPMSDIQLAAFFGESGKTLYAEARRVRERYPPEHYAQIMAVVNPANGARVHYKHLAILLRLEDPAEANKALDLCLASAWNTKELADHVSKRLRQLQGMPRAKRPRPGNFVGVVENIAAGTEEWQRMYEEDWGAGKKLLDTFDALPEERLTVDLARRVKEAEAMIRKAVEGQEYLAQELANLQRRIESAVHARRHGGRTRAAIIPEAEQEGEAAEGGVE